VTALEERPTKPIALSDAIRELDSPESVADRKRRAAEMAKKVTGTGPGCGSFPHYPRPRARRGPNQKEN
jgi:hypothetical protein